MGALRLSRPLDMTRITSLPYAQGIAIIGICMELRLDVFGLFCAHALRRMPERVSETKCRAILGPAVALGNPCPCTPASITQPCPAVGNVMLCPALPCRRRAALSCGKARAGLLVPLQPVDTRYNPLRLKVSHRLYLP
jgi:hypothetical protein